MKASEAPERIWIDPTSDLPKLSGHIDKDSVEYIRVDAFIEKAQNFFRQSHYLFRLDGMDLQNFVEDFRNYMKEH